MDDRELERKTAEDGIVLQDDETTPPMVQYKPSADSRSDEAAGGGGIEAADFPEASVVAYVPVPQIEYLC